LILWWQLNILVAVNTLFGFKYFGGFLNSLVACATKQLNLNSLVATCHQSIKLQPNYLIKYFGGIFFVEDEVWMHVSYRVTEMTIRSVSTRSASHGY